jgi:hypothetical protein
VDRSYFELGRRDGASPFSSGHRLLQALVKLIEEGGRAEPGFVRPDQERQILGHEAGFDGIDADRFQRLAKCSGI